ncbi:MAG: CbrC family protein [Chloroflexota bacterium]
MWSSFWVALYCVVCDANHLHGFELDIGCVLIQNCPVCNAQNGLDTSDRINIFCQKCAHELEFPQVNGPIHVCYACLRAGHAAITKDTEYGMIGWGEAIEGVTHGLPGLQTTEFEMVPKEEEPSEPETPSLAGVSSASFVILPKEERWVGVRMPQDVMSELLQTPTFCSWQGEQWLFCCQQPMVYLGNWTKDDFTSCISILDGKALFLAAAGGYLDELWETGWSDSIGIYVFQCTTCGKHRAYHDCD